jgi:hypothetical protein
MLHEKERWVYGPWSKVVKNEIEMEYPAVADYAMRWQVLHYEPNGFCLTFCRMNVHQLLAIRQDARFTVLDSITSDGPVPDKVIAHKKATPHGKKLANGMKVREFLAELGKGHPGYEPHH